MVENFVITSRNRINLNNNNNNNKDNNKREKCRYINISFGKALGVAGLNNC